MENTHAARYHMRRILGHLADDATDEMFEHPYQSEAAMHVAADWTPRRLEDEQLADLLRYQIKLSARLLLTIERRTGRFG